MEKTKTQIKLFEEQKVRTVWDSEKEEWYFSVIDVVQILTDSKDPKQYIKKMRSRDEQLNLNWGTICTPVRMKGKDGKSREIQAATSEGIFRLIQSIPSPKAEPFKLWMAQVAKERLDEMQDPEQGIQRALQEYRALGYSENWINQRLKSIEIRKDLTDEWKKHGLKEGVQFELSQTLSIRLGQERPQRNTRNSKGSKKKIFGTT